MTAAEIDTEGGIIFITLFKYLIIIKVSAPRGVLPDDDFSVCVACCSNFFCVLCSSDCAFAYAAENTTMFEEVSELIIIEISRTSEHCMAVSDDGKVFSRGSNEYGQLDLGDKCIGSEINK